ncbi:MAG: hypothetical protein K0R14_938 [Burkholderiales bacterium]|jgi:hypothetical protein|nr:hypothetical protein [Burkholderiales bacterium]
MENVLLTHKIEKNKKLNRISKWGYVIAAMFDPYGLVSLVFALLLWGRRAGKKQISGFIINMIIHIVASYIFDLYFNNLTGTIVYSIVFATAVPFVLYRSTMAPTKELEIAELTKVRVN